MEYEHSFDLREPPAEVPASEAVARPTGGGDEAIRRTAEILVELRDLRAGAVFETRLQRKTAVDLAGQLRTLGDGWLCDLTQDLGADDPDVDASEVLRQEARLGGREAKRMEKVARRLQDMPKVAEKFKAGDITLAHVNTLVNAAEKVGAEAVEAANDLLDDAAEMLPDKFEREGRDWANRLLIESGDDLLERQRQAREARMWVERNTGLGVIYAKLPAPVFARIQQAADRRYLELLQRDSADGKDPDSVRSPHQRMADVMSELLTSLDPETGEVLEEACGGRAKPSTQLVLAAPFDLADGTDPNGHVEMVGVGPVPRSVLETLSPDTELAGMIYDRAGRILWLGRSQRLANAPQRLVVALRDGGCFECGAPMHQCELHHVQPWAEGGRTDVDNLVAVCRRHHRWLESENLVVRRVGRRWVAEPRDGPDPPT